MHYKITQYCDCFHSNRGKGLIPRIGLGRFSFWLLFREHARISIVEIPDEGAKHIKVWCLLAIVPMSRHRTSSPRDRDCAAAPQA